MQAVEITTAHCDSHQTELQSSKYSESASHFDHDDAQNSHARAVECNEKAPGGLWKAFVPYEP